jgi:RNA polymerase sigma factor (sigma-70 family)
VPTQTQANVNGKPSIEEIVQELYTNHQPYLLAIAIRNTPTKADAEEALQDAFTLFIHHFEPSSGAPPLAWITLTLKRRCWALYRRQTGNSSFVQTQPPSSFPVAPGSGSGTWPTTPEEAVELNEVKTQAREAITRLKPAERTALTYQALGCSYAEIRQLTGWTYTKVNRCITEGRARLRRGQQKQATR